MHDADDPDEPSGWHRLPKDDAWKRCTLRGIVDDGKRLWIECYGCGRFEYLPITQRLRPLAWVSIVFCDDGADIGICYRGAAPA